MCLLPLGSLVPKSQFLKDPTFIRNDGLIIHDPCTDLSFVVPGFLSSSGTTGLNILRLADFPCKSLVFSVQLFHHFSLAQASGFAGNPCHAIYLGLGGRDSPDVHNYIEAPTSNEMGPFSLLYHLGSDKSSNSPLFSLYQ